MTIGLAMVCRDEAKEISLCLESVKPLIDTWTVVDTGSLDDTPAIVEDLLSDLPGVLHHRTWTSHAVNRNELLDLAHGTADYLLLLDADCVLHLDGELPPLTADYYAARLTGGFQHTLPLLINGHRNGWHWKGVAHAYLANDDPISTDILEGVRIEELRSSSPRTDKIQRDAEALEAEIDPRTIFYLAQSYRDLGDLDPGYRIAAADLYRLRIRHSAGHPQEVFWACYSEGLIRLETDFDRGVGVLLEAYQRRPSRAEPLWLLARTFRLRGQPQIALLFADQACLIPSTDDEHFVLAWIYDWGSLQERALCRIAVGDTAGARDDFKLIAQRDDDAGKFAREQIEALA